MQKQGTEIQATSFLILFVFMSLLFLSVTESQPHAALRASCVRDIVSPVTLSLVKVLSSLHEGKEGYLSRILCSGGYTGMKTRPWGFLGPKQEQGFWIHLETSEKG